MRFKRNDEILHVQTNGEVVMLEVDTGHYHHLNETASAIWSVLAEPRELDEVCNLLRQEFHGEHDVIRSEIQGFITALVDRKLLLEVPSGGS